MAEVLLGQSYYLRFDARLFEVMEPYPPLGCMAATAMLREVGHDVALFDAMLAESESEWAARLDVEKPRIAVLFEDSFNYLSKMCLARMREAAFTMMVAAKARGCTVVVAGSDASDEVALYLDNGADWVISGEGELTLLELLAHLEGREGAREPADILGLSWRDGFNGTGKVTENPRRKVMRSLDELPAPAWDLIDTDRYRRVWRERHGRYSVNVVTTRGCPYHCNWCAKPIWGQRYNVRSPEAVAREFAWLKRELGAEHVWIVDDIFGLKPGWLKRFAAALEKEGVRLPFKALSRADLLTRPGDAEALARAGCETMWMGAESGSQKILDAMEKGTKVEEIVEAARLLHEVGVKVAFFLQFGYPGETREDIDMTRELVRKGRPDHIGISVAYPLPGTPFYERVQDQLGTKRHWFDSADMAMMFAGPYPTEFYRALYHLIHEEHRAFRRVDELKAAAKRPGELRLVHARTVASLVTGAGRWLARRARLEWLQRRPHQGIGPLEHELDHAAAATPSPQ